MTMPALHRRTALVAPESRRGTWAKVKNSVSMALILLKPYLAPWAAAQHGKPSPDSTFAVDRARVDTFFPGMWPR